MSWLRHHVQKKIYIKCPSMLLQCLNSEVLNAESMEFATSIMDADTKWLLNHRVDSSPLGWFLLSLFPIGQHLHFVSCQLSTSQIIYTSERWIGSLPYMFMMWWANLPSTTSIMKAPSSLLSAFMKIVGLRQYHKYRMQHFECA